MALNNAILIYEENGEIKQRFCHEQEARDYLATIQAGMSGGSMFASDGIEAEFVMSVSPDLRDRVAAAKTKLKSDTRLRDILNKHGVPLDQDLRIAISKAFADWKSGISIAL